jgi:hypothetical protein
VPRDIAPRALSAFTLLVVKSVAAAAATAGSLLEPEGPTNPTISQTYDPLEARLFPRRHPIPFSHLRGRMGAQVIGRIPKVNLTNYVNLG